MNNKDLKFPVQTQFEILLILSCEFFLEGYDFPVFSYCNPFATSVWRSGFMSMRIHTGHHSCVKLCFSAWCRNCHEYKNDVANFAGDREPLYIRGVKAC